MSFTGGKVMDPVIGLHSNVAVLDYKQYYVSVIRSANLGPDTRLESRHEETDTVRMPNGGEFTKLFRSLANEIVTEIAEERGEEKILRDETLDVFGRDSHEYKIHDENQGGLKVEGNKNFGFLTMPYSRFYDLVSGEAITWGAQQGIGFMNAVVEGTTATEAEFRKSGVPMDFSSGRSSRESTEIPIP
jgi:DNA polymerase elongation subunit (family B)